MTSWKSKQKKYIVLGLAVLAIASAVAFQIHQNSSNSRRRPEPASSQDPDHSLIPSTKSTLDPAAPSQPSIDEVPEDAGQTSEEGLNDLGKQIEASLADHDMETAVRLIAQRSLIQVSAFARKDSRIQGIEFQRLHLQDMEAYAKIYPQLQGSYDYNLTLLTAAFASESLPLLEKRIASIRTRFSQLIDRDNDCISYLLALRRNDPDTSSWKTLCETGTSEYSTYSKGMAETIRKFWP